MGRRIGCRATKPLVLFAACLLSLGSCSNVLLSKLMLLRSGDLLYTANIVENTISGFTLNEISGQLVVLPDGPFSAGIHPASLAVASKRFVYCVNEGDASIFPGIGSTPKPATLRR